MDRRLAQRLAGQIYPPAQRYGDRTPGRYNHHLAIAYTLQLLPEPEEHILLEGEALLLDGRALFRVRVDTSDEAATWTTDRFDLGGCTETITLESSGMLNDFGEGEIETVWRISLPSGEPLELRGRIGEGHHGGVDGPERFARALAGKLGWTSGPDPEH